MGVSLVYLFSFNIYVPVLLHAIFIQNFSSLEPSNFMYKVNEVAKERMVIFLTLVGVAFQRPVPVRLMN